MQDSKAQVTALQLIIGTLQRTRVFGVENRDTLTHKATGVNNLSNRFHLVVLLIAYDTLLQVRYSSEIVVTCSKLSLYEF